MSKKKGARKRHRKHRTPAVLCPRCRKAPDDSPRSLLRELAAALNSCEQAGLRVRFRHGAAYSEYGVVVPPLERGGWVARPFIDGGGTPADPDDPDT